MGEGDLTSNDCARETFAAEQKKSNAEARAPRHKSLRGDKVDIIKNNTGRAAKQTLGAFLVRGEYQISGPNEY